MKNKKKELKKDREMKLFYDIYPGNIEATITDRKNRIVAKIYATTNGLMIVPDRKVIFPLEEETNTYKKT